MSEALYRKYRPQVFSAVVGQNHIEHTLKNAIDQDKVSHAYLFCGPRGTGKTTTARLLAKALLCEHGPTSNPCGECAECQDIANGVHPDVYELDAASRTGVDNVREEIISRVQFSPTRGNKKVYIIDEVHMLSTAAFNALLKTLEEPPSHVVFVLCTTDPQKVPETILSRVQRFDFKRIENDNIVERLAQVCEAEGVNFERDALSIIAARSGGGMRNALTALEQAIIYGEGTVGADAVAQLGGVDKTCDLEQIVSAIANRDMAQCFLFVEDFANNGGDYLNLATNLAQRFRDIYLYVLLGKDAPLHVDSATKEKIANAAQLFGAERLSYALSVLGEASSQLKYATNQRLVIEIALTKLTHAETDLTLESLAARIEELEKHGVAASAVHGEATRPRAQVEEKATVAQTHEAAAPAHEAAAPAREVATAKESNTQVSSPANYVTPDERVQSSTSNATANVVQESNKTEESAQPAASQAHVKSGQSLDNPVYVQRIWQMAYNHIKRESPSSALKIMNAKAFYENASNTLFVQLPETSVAIAPSMMTPKVEKYLSGVIDATSHVSVPVKVCIAGGAAGGVAREEVKAAHVETAAHEKTAATVREAAIDVSQETHVGVVVAEKDAHELQSTDVSSTLEAQNANAPESHDNSAYEQPPADVYNAYEPFETETHESSYWDDVELPEDADMKTPEGAEELSDLLIGGFGETIKIEEI